MRAAITNQLADYRELDAPLKRSMRRWWAGPGRLWLVAIGACGFIRIIFTIVATDYLQSGAASTWFDSSLMLTIVTLAEGTGLILSLICWQLIGRIRSQTIAQFLQESALPDRKSALRYSYASSLLAGWPVLLLAAVVNLATVTSFFFLNPITRGNTGYLLSNLPKATDEPMMILFMMCLSLAYMHCFGGRAANWFFLGLLGLKFATVPLQVMFSNGNSLVFIDFIPHASHLVVVSGILTVLSILAGSFMLARRNQCLTWLWPILFLSLFRVAELATEYFSSPLLLRDGAHWHEYYLRGIQVFLGSPPFKYAIHSFGPQLTANGTPALVMFWNSGLAIPIGPIGYLLALLLNLCWLACVFLFCRWAVGRISWREED